MTAPGPVALGRSVVVPSGGAIPSPWADAPVVTVDDTAVGDPIALAALVDRLHRSWVGRERVVIELDVDDDDLRAPQVEIRPVFELGASFSFLRERLHFLVWANSYDARRDPPRWWWGVKAEPFGARPDDVTDVVLPDGTSAWIDGGPRGPVPGVSDAIVHSETVSAGSLAPVPHASSGKFGDDLAVDQIEAVAHPAGATRIIAPAGSGKTRTLVARLRHLVDERHYEPGAVCALAYNTKAAAEMRDRLGAARGVRVRTIHSLGWEILREARGDLALLDEREVRGHLDRLVQVPPRPNTDTVGPYLEALGETRIALRAPQDVEDARDDVPDFTVVYRKYRERLRGSGEADFDEQVYGAIEALLADPDLRRRWQGRCRHMLVDEFQDLTAAYLLLIRLVASPELDVFGVGDDDQTIYGYAGADPAYLIDYDALFPGAGAHALEVNYRCPPPVVDAATNLLGYNRRRIDKTIVAGRTATKDRDGFAVELRGGSDMGVDGADRILSWLRETDPTEIAVLSRVNSALLPVHLALGDRDVAFRSPLGPDLLRRTVISAALAWMRLGLDPEHMSRADVLAAVRRPSRGLNRLASELLRGSHFDIASVLDAGRDLDGRRAVNWDGFVEDLERVAGAAEDDDAGALLDAVISRVGLDSSALALDRGRTRADRAGQSDDLIALRRAAAIHPSLADFEGWIRATLAGSGGRDGVLLSTVHRAKGLEWDRVIVFGADQGLLPHVLSEDWEEERRIFHVAITRCRDEVVVLADRDRPSPFLAELTGKAKKPTRPEEPGGRAATPRGRAASHGVSVAVGVTVRLSGGYEGIVEEADSQGIWVAVPGGALLQARWGDEIDAAGTRGPLLRPSEELEPDAGLVARLKTWRLEVSREKAVPAFVILHDTTLETIAATRPQTEAALAAVPGIGPAKLEAYGDAIIEICGQ